MGIYLSNATRMMIRGYVVVEFTSLKNVVVVVVVVVVVTNLKNSYYMVWLPA